MTVLLFGAGGQLGTELVQTNPGLPLRGLTRTDMDITSASEMEKALDAFHPEVVINATAYNRTEDAETHENEALAVNTWAPRSLAALCAGRGIKVVHFSTDFVFDGKKGSPYLESDAASPVSMYGFSKWGGEQFVRTASSANMVIRTSGLYGIAGSRAKGGNFVDTVLTRARAGQPLRVVNDIRFSPSFARDVAQRTWILIEKNVAGLWHVANDGGCTWFAFAQAIIEEAGLSAVIEPIASAQWPGKMKRSPDTRLSSHRGAELGLPPLRGWRDALVDYLLRKKMVAPSRRPPGS